MPLGIKVVAVLRVITGFVLVLVSAFTIEVTWEVSVVEGSAEFEPSALVFEPVAALVAAVVDKSDLTISVFWSWVTAHLCMSSGSS